MPKLIVAEQISLDGVIRSPGAPKEDPSGEFTRILLGPAASLLMAGASTMKHIVTEPT